MEEVIAFWLKWHFFEQPRLFLKIIKNLFLFGIDYFSMPLLLQTLFSPWRRYTWAYPRGLDIGKIFETFISNLISRIIGMVMRLFLLFFGAIFEIVVLFGGIFFIFCWVFSPLIIIFLISYAFSFIF
jgi:hypothetical protein